MIQLDQMKGHLKVLSLLVSEENLSSEDQCLRMLCLEILKLKLIFLEGEMCPHVSFLFKLSKILCPFHRSDGICNISPIIIYHHS